MSSLMKRAILWQRLYLWIPVIGTMIFQLIMWRRVSLSKQDRIGPQVPQTSELVSNDTADHPLVSIIVPARNEERNIRRCVESLLEQDYEPFEVIAVNDDSTDATGSILEDIAAHHPRGQQLHILHLHELPQGWTGKTHAVHCGTQEARGDWFLLTDADTWHSPPALRTTLTRAIEEGVDMFSIEPIHELDFWNKVLTPNMYVGFYMLHPPHVVNNPASPVATANGQYMLLRRSVYDAAGGLARPGVREAQTEDRNLAMVVKGDGFRLRFVVDNGLVHTYRFSGLAEFWHGISRYAYPGKRNLPLFLFSLFSSAHVNIRPFLIALLVWFGRGRQRRTKESIHPVEAGIAIALEEGSMIAFHAWLNRQVHVPVLYSLTQPLARCIMTSILINSLWRGLIGKTSWRGRVYSQGNAEAEPGATPSTDQTLSKIES